MQNTGSSYTSANAGTLHTHPAPVLVTVSGAPFGVSRTADMSAASAAIAAGLAGCEPCRASAMARLMLGDSLVLAVLAASLPQVPNRELSSITYIFCNDVQPHEYPPYTYDFTAGLGAVQRQNLLEDLVGIWTAVIPHLVGDTGTDLTAVVIDLTPAPPLAYRAGRTGFVPTPHGPFPALTLTSPDMTGSIEDLSERCGFPLYAWDTLPDVTDWVLQQHSVTLHPWGVCRVSEDGQTLALGSVEHPAEATSEWTGAAQRAGSVLVLGLWSGGFESLIHVVQAQEIFAVRARLHP
ncbi:hypothetical protein AQI84_38680 [Streptomyces griseorubiginosus]|nr:hypothetical protein AQI84_38680 [Streptomyces griseorubiginosus]